MDGSKPLQSPLAAPASAFEPQVHILRVLRLVGFQGLGFGAYISVCQATEFGFPGKTKPWAGAVVSSGCSVSSGVSVAHVSVVSVRRGLMH